MKKKDDSEYVIYFMKYNLNKKESWNLGFVRLH